VRRADETAVVRRPLDLEDGVVDLLAGPGERLLELRLVVDVARPGVLDLLGKGRDDGRLDALEAVLEVERRERGFEERGEDVPAPRDALQLVRRDVSGTLGELLAQTEVLRDGGAARPRDDVGPDLRQAALRRLPEAVEDGPRDRELENAVAQELEALVGGGPVVRPGRVREDLLETRSRKLGDQAAELRGPASRARPATPSRAR
jgi:hypothetical protein